MILCFARVAACLLAFRLLISAAAAQDFTVSPARVSDPDTLLRKSLLESSKPPSLTIDQWISDPAGLASEAEGQQLDLGRFKGKVVVLYFFSSRCGRCPEASRQIGSLYLTTSRADLVIIGIISGQSPANEAFALPAKYRLPFSVIHDQKDGTFSSFGIVGVPIFCLIDASGKLTKYCYTDKLRFCATAELNKLRQFRASSPP